MIIKLQRLFVGPTVRKSADLRTTELTHCLWLHMAFSAKSIKKYQMHKSYFRNADVSHISIPPSAIMHSFLLWLEYCLYSPSRRDETCHPPRKRPVWPKPSVTQDESRSEDRCHISICWRLFFIILCHSPIPIGQRQHGLEPLVTLLKKQYVAVSCYLYRPRDGKKL